MLTFRTRHLLIVLLSGVLLSTIGTSAQNKLLPVTLLWQETSEWCWAASGQMLMNDIIPTGQSNPKWTPQCYEANEEFNRTDCCTCPTPSACVRGGWPQFSTWGYQSNQTTWGTALSWSQVTGEINVGRPFMFSWAWNGGGAHAMVAYGYYTFNFLGIKLNYVLVNNPWPPQNVSRCGSGGKAAGPFGGDNQWDTYAEFVGGPGYDHTHGSDISNIH
jgi:Peptidase_C39 like family